MAEEIKIDGPTQKRGARGLNGEAQVVRDAVARLEHRLHDGVAETEGAMEDPVSKAYHKNYPPMEEGVVQVARDLADYLEGLAANLDATLREQEGAEDRNARRSAP
jgi:hypothetical protein